MVGRRVLLRVAKTEARPGAEVLRAENLRHVDARGVERLRGVSFAVRAGEIVGIAGVAGNGQSELIEVLAGLRALQGGRVLYKGEPLTAPGHAQACKAARASHIAHVPEDRFAHGARRGPCGKRKAPSLGYHDDVELGPGPMLSARAATERTRRLMAEYDVRPPVPAQRSGDFSGGNQQKIVLGREIDRDPDLLIVGQPTRGVDIGAIEFIHRRLVALRDAGKAILLVSCELDEILGLADRILVMFDGRIMGELARHEADERSLGLLMAGSHAAAGGMSGIHRLPPWVDWGLLPLVNLVAAGLLSSLVVLAIGVNPLQALAILVNGAVGYPEALGYTLYYATNFVFTGLAVAIAFHAGLFNIGGEGQAYVAGLGVALVCLFLEGLPGFVAVPLAILAAAAFGAAWGAVPGWLQARRGSHIVITTIMFNFIAAALMTYLLSNVLLDPTHGSPETRRFAGHTTLWSLGEMAGWFGLEAPRTPLNAAFFLALAAAGLVWVYVWHTRAGYELRTVGANEQAARYAGIDPARTIVVAMAISGALAGLMAVNEVAGRPAAPAARLHRRLRLRGHRGRVDGPQSSDGHLPCRPAVRRALPGRGRTRLRGARHQPRPRHRHPGPDHPVLRRAGEHVPPGGSPGFSHARGRPDGRPFRPDRLAARLDRASGRTARAVRAGGAVRRTLGPRRYRA